MLKWIIGVPVALLVAFFALGFALQSPERDRQNAEAAKEECARAITSSIGTSTTSYADRKAYNDHVRDKCRGFGTPPLRP